MRIYTQIDSCYKVIELSGQIPLNIGFGLYRRSLANPNPRPLLLDTASKVLDILYALVHGLLII